MKFSCLPLTNNKKYMYTVLVLVLWSQWCRERYASTTLSSLALASDYAILFTR